MEFVIMGKYIAALLIILGVNLCAEMPVAASEQNANAPAPEAAVAEISDANAPETAVGEISGASAPEAAVAETSGASAPETASPPRPLMRTPSSPTLLSETIGYSTVELEDYECIYNSEQNINVASDSDVLIVDAVTKSDMLQDSNWINVQVHRLAKMFGVEKREKLKIVNISYPYLLKYAIEHTDGELRTWIQRINDIAVSKNGAIDEKAIDKLYEEAKTHLFRIESRDEEQFKKIFVAMASNFTGEQRIKSLIILQRLIDEGITGASHYRGRRIMIVLGAESSVYYHIAHRIGLKNAIEHNGYVILKMEKGTQTTFESLSSRAATLTHEFSHAYHFMLGMYAPNVVNSPFVAALGNADFRKRLYPFLEKDVSEAIVQSINEKFPNATDNTNHTKNMRTFIKSTFAKAYDFLKANKFFGNQNLDLGNLDENFGGQASYGKVAAAFIACYSLKNWDNGEETLTISGILPVEFPIPGSDGTHKYLIVDNQNESTFLTRDANAIRLFHSANDDLKKVAAGSDSSSSSASNDATEQISELLSILSNIIDEKELFIQRSQKKMGEFNSSAVTVSEEDRTITTEEITAAIRIIASYRWKFLSFTCKNFLRCMIEDLANYSAILNIKLERECVNTCAINDLLVDSVLSGALRGSTTPLKEELTEMLSEVLGAYNSNAMTYNNLQSINIAALINIFFDLATKEKADETISSLISVVKKNGFLANFLEYCSGDKKNIFSDNDMLSVLDDEIKNKNTKNIEIIFDYMSKKKMAIDDAKFNEISQYYTSVPDSDIEELCAYASANGKKIDLTEYILKSLKEGYLLSDIKQLDEQYPSVLRIDLEACIEEVMKKVKGTTPAESNLCENILGHA
ncbi:MAG: hypothetical protein LBB63_04250, partial [Holosporaceae bacterium]|nr:hypothetical protein [Holosporaceae bacterium]